MTAVEMEIGKVLEEFSMRVETCVLGIGGHDKEVPCLCDKKKATTDLLALFKNRDDELVGEIEKHIEDWKRNHRNWRDIQVGLQKAISIIRAQTGK